ncbi:transposable element Tcb2 transposase [Trichonephila clavipes]|nr:transposable element Tcb2 transposase [Trichonephila clavipes]
MSAPSIRRRRLHFGMLSRVPLYRFPLTAEHRWLRLQWDHVHRGWQAQHMQLLLWVAYSQDMSPIELVWNLISRRQDPDSRPAASKDEPLLRIHAIWNSLRQMDIQILFESMPRCIATLIVERGGYTKH